MNQYILSVYHSNGDVLMQAVYDVSAKIAKNKAVMKYTNASYIHIMEVEHANR